MLSGHVEHVVPNRRGDSDVGLGLSLAARART
jgi:hypothetical protein